MALGTRILVFGSTGQVARELRRARWPDGFEPIFLDRQAADLSRPETLGAVVRDAAPAAVVIAAAYTAVDKAESEEALATRVNADAPGAIAAAAAERAIPVIHFSTDYVFDGSKPGIYEEDDPTGPVGAYGRSKLAGETKLRQGNPRHLILRTSWVYSAHGVNFLRTMLRLAATREEVRVVADQTGCPTAAGDLAEAVLRLLPAALAGQAPWGTYHLPGGKATTWHGFAEAIFKELAARGLPRPRNLAIPTSDYPTPAARPANSRLSGAKFERAFGFALPGYDQAMPAILTEALSAG